MLVPTTGPTPDLTSVLHRETLYREDIPLATEKKKKLCRGARTEEMLRNKSRRLFVGLGMRGRGWHPENGALVWTDGSSLVLHPLHPSRDEGQREQ